MVDEESVCRAALAVGFLVVIDELMDDESEDDEKAGMEEETG